MSKQHYPSSSGSILSSSSSFARPTAPQLLFDDGSRVIQEQKAVASDADAAEIVESKQRSSYAQARGSLPLVEYYEIDRLVCEIQKLSKNSTCWKNRIALQFPDELLVDSPDVCWELEQALITVTDDDNDNTTNEPLVFCLGDTTYQSCCPDLVAAAHLQADCLVHFGHACLSNHNAAASSKIPVIYSFGKAEIPVEHVAQQVLVEIQKSAIQEKEKQQQEESSVQRILLLSEVRYVYAMEQLQQRLTSEGNVQVAVGRIPENRISLSTPSPLSSQNDSAPPPPQSSATACGSPSCCQNVINDKEGVCKTKEDAVPSGSLTTTEENLLTCKEHGFIVGGLELPRELDTWTSPYTLLFVGSDESRQYLNIVLRFLSSTNNDDNNRNADHHHQQSPTNYWTWNPATNSLSTQLSPRFKRQLNRRFYLVQKARLAQVFGLLVANLSDVYMQSVVHSLRSLIEQHQQHQHQHSQNPKACYTFVVGKINPAKISNFAEIDCFVMVACPEHSLLLADEEREYPVPIITPLELTMALGLVEWGTVAYSLDSHDYMLQQDNIKGGAAPAASTMEQETDGEDEDSDAPYFNPVTGRYESYVKQHNSSREDLNLAALPGQGTLTKYTSAASDFLKLREYQGLQVDAGETKVAPAIAGHQGIASNYGER